MSNEQERNNVGIAACVGIILILIGALVKMSQIPMILLIVVGSCCFSCYPLMLLQDYCIKQAERRPPRGNYDRPDLDLRPEDDY